MIYIGHRSTPLVYGVLIHMGDGMYFERRKWTIVNQKKSPPKVCAEIMFTTKKVGEDIWKSFVELSEPEYMQRFVDDMQETNKKLNEGV